MSGADEEWVTAAMSEDAMVVELLVSLHHAPPPPPKRTAFPLEWTVRQRRSKYASSAKNRKKTPPRGSPVTPLSWSGGTSFSAGSDESIRSKLSSKTRSKVVNVDSEKTNSKRPRKKKTLAELKAEENLMLKERRDLKKELVALRLYLDRQRAVNGNLKRMKTELTPHPYEKLQPTSVAQESVSGELQLESSTVMPPAAVDGGDVKILLQPSNACPEEEQKLDAKLILPDLNMPFDEPTWEVRN